MKNTVTHYSDKIEGTTENYDWSVRFNDTDGCVGITQFEGNTVKDSVLLSKLQVRELIAFVKRHSSKRKRK